MVLELKGFRDCEEGPAFFAANHVDSPRKSCQEARAIEIALSACSQGEYKLC